MDFVDVANGLIGIPVEELGQLEADIAVLNQFECEVNNGGWDQYFFNSSGDNAIRLKEAAQRHNCDQLVSWLDNVSSISPMLLSPDRDERLDAIRALPDEADSEITDLAYDIAEDAVGIWVKLAQSNLEELIISYNKRRQQGDSEGTPLRGAPDL